MNLENASEQNLHPHPKETFVAFLKRGQDYMEAEHSSLFKKAGIALALKENFQNLIKLTKPDYMGEQVLDGLFDDGRPMMSTEHEFEDSYTDPKAALVILIEISQLKLEFSGKPRREIITMEQANKMREQGGVFHTQENVV